MIDVGNAGMNGKAPFAVMIIASESSVGGSVAGSGTFFCTLNKNGTVFDGNDENIQHCFTCEAIK